MVKQQFIKDILAGLAVSFAALSLGAAFGAMSGRGAFAGMVGAAIIPIITSIFGGTRIQASGPTAPMTAVTALVVSRAYDAFTDKVMAEQFITLVIIMSGCLMIIAGLLKLGKLIQYVPNAVVLGFMNGIAVLIWYDQICKLFGFNGKDIITGNFYTNIIVAFSTIFCIFTFPQFVKMLGVKPKYRSFLSALLLSILFMTVVASIFNLEIQKVALGATFATFQDFGNIIYKYFPTSEILTLSNVQLALPLALQLMLLGYLDSLLTALVIDRITKEKTLQNKELIAQGVSNAVSGILQGIPGAQATIRSVLLVKEQAQTRFAGVMLGVFVLISIIFFKSWIALIPSAVFAGVLFKAGWDVSDRDYMKMYFKYDWVKSINRNFQMFIILYTTIATVIFDLNVAVITGSVFFYIIIFVFKKYELKDVESEMEDNID